MKKLVNAKVYLSCVILSAVVLLVLFYQANIVKASSLDKMVKSPE